MFSFFPIITYIIIIQGTLDEYFRNFDLSYYFLLGRWTRYQWITMRELGVCVCVCVCVRVCGRLEGQCTYHVGMIKRSASATDSRVFVT